MELGPAVPRRSRPFWRWVGRAILRAWGWDEDVRFPNVPKVIVIAAPHTSNWDFVFGIATILALDLDLHWIAKHTLFEGMWGRFFRFLGGIPVNRTAPGGVVQQTAEAFARSQQLAIAITPEGTRSRREVWKRGFYHIALEAQVPVVVAYIDYARKRCGTVMSFLPSGDWEADMKPVFEFYRTVTPKTPDNFAVEG